MQDKRKRLFWVKFFSSKVPKFLHVLFNLVVKHSPVFFLAVLHFVSEKNEDKRRANRGKNKTRGKIQDFNIKKKSSTAYSCFYHLHHVNTYKPMSRKFKEWFSPVAPCCVHCACLDILSLFYSETKCKTAKKNTVECFTTKLKSTCKTSGTFE